MCAKQSMMSNHSIVKNSSISATTILPHTRLLGTLVVLAFLSACASKINQLPEQAEVVVPESWQTNQATQTTAADAEAKVEEPQPVKDAWLDSFEDGELSKYVEQALQNNPDLLGSAAELKSAIEQVTITGASLWPNLSANARNSRTEIDSSAGGQVNVPGVGLVNNESSVTTVVRTVSGTLDISWEADVWGKLTQRKKASALSAQAQAELYNAAELSLVANVSRAWYNLVTNKLQVDLAQRRLESFENTAKLIDENYQRGLRSALDVYLSRTDVELQRSRLADSKFNYISSLRTFKSLLGDYPDASLEFQAKLPELTGTAGAGLPAELLTRRPDLKASQLRYQAAIASAKAAQRDRYPAISFQGSIGDSRERFSELFKDDNLVTSLVGNFTQPLFQAGALKARQEQAFYEAERSYASLLRTTLQSFEEVENAISRESLLFEQHEAIKEAVKLAEGGLNLALDRYQSGIENYTTVLQSQRSLFDSLQNEINLRNALLQNRIGLHLALGGDFMSEQDRASEAIPLPTAIKDSTQASADTPTSEATTP